MGGRARPLGRAHLLAADVQELVGHVERRLPVEDAPRNRVGAVAGSAGRGQVLAAALDGGADQAPARGPVNIPDQLGATAERRHLAAVAAADRPFHQARPALVGDFLAVPGGGDGGPDLAAVLADHVDRQPVRRMVDRADRAVDLQDHGGSVERLLDVGVHVPGRIALAHPIELGLDPQALERLEEQTGEVARVVGRVAPRGGGHVREGPAHGRLDGIGRQQGLGVHGVQVLDAVTERDVQAAFRDGAADGIVEHHAAQAAHVDGARGSLGIVDDLRPIDGRGKLVGPEEGADLRLRTCGHLWPLQLMPTIL